jgi:hypothetical protein
MYSLGCSCLSFRRSSRYLRRNQGTAPANWKASPVNLSVVIPKHTEEASTAYTVEVPIRTFYAAEVVSTKFSWLTTAA